jgi:hypothetical protein
MDDCERLAIFYHRNERFIQLWHHYVQHSKTIPSHPFPYNKDYRYLGLWLQEVGEEIATDIYDEMINLVNYFIEETNWLRQLERKYP